METGLLELFSSQLQREGKVDFYTWCTQSSTETNQPGCPELPWDQP